MVIVNRGEVNSKKARLPRSRLFRLFFRTMLILLTLTIFVAAIASTEASPGEYDGWYIIASPLSIPPEEYFTLTNPDPYTLQVFSNPGKSVSVDNVGETQISKLIDTHGTDNVLYDGCYYKIGYGVSVVCYPAPFFLGSPFIPYLVMLWLLWGIFAMFATVGVRLGKLK